MRLISQDMRIDLPYDRFVISSNLQNSKEIIAWTGLDMDKDECIVMATYSSSDKAQKVIQMLRDTYVGVPIIMQNVEVEESVIEKLKDTNTIMANITGQPSGIEYINKGYFRFPKDEDVEV